MEVLYSDDIKKIQDYLAENPNALNKYKGKGYTPLMYAATSGRSDVLDYLISVSGGNLINSTFGFKTVLHYSCYSNDVDEIIIRKLVEAGASGTIQDALGNAPLHTAAEYTSNPNIIYILFPISDPSMLNKFNKTALMAGCCKNKNKGVIEALVNISNDINFQNVDGETCLHSACSNNNYVAIKTLLDLGADLTITCGSEMAPYDVSDEKGDEIICEYIRNKKVQTSQYEKILYEISRKISPFGIFDY